MLDKAALLKRDSRLLAMGVQPWYARAQLPGAAESNLLRAALDAQPAPKVAEKNAALPETDIETLPSSVEPNVASSKQIRPTSFSTPSATQDDLKPAAAIMAQFEEKPVQPWAGDIALHAYEFEQVMVFLESDQSVSKAQEREFLRNLMFAVFRKDQNPNELAEFAWPVFRWPEAATDPGAHEFLPLLQRYIDDQGTGEIVLYFGAELNDQIFQELSFKSQSVFRIGAATPAQCLRDHYCKPRLWEELVVKRSGFDALI